MGQGCGPVPAGSVDFLGFGAFGGPRDAFSGGEGSGSGMRGFRKAADPRPNRARHRLSPGTAQANRTVAFSAPSLRVSAVCADSSGRTAARL